MAWNLNQGDIDLGTYFTFLSKLWQELDLVDDFQWKCTEDCKRFKARINKECIYYFLAWLNQDLDVVRSRILTTEPLPEIEEVFAEVQREETWKRVMLNPTKAIVSVPVRDDFALAAHGVDRACGDACKDTCNTRRTGNLWCGDARKEFILLSYITLIFKYLVFNNPCFHFLLFDYFLHYGCQVDLCCQLNMYC